MILEAVRAALARVDDPELPGVSIVDLGIVHDVAGDEESVVITLLPTFLGCPALEEIRQDVESAAAAVASGAEIVVVFGTTPVWSPDRITARGREALADLTIGVPPEVGATACPVCRSNSTEERSAFGATACRSIGYCSSCRNPIELIRR